jgi:hypothetical protein
MTKEHERLWGEAKKAAAKEGKHGDWAYIQGIFQRMVKGEHKPQPANKPDLKMAAKSRMKQMDAQTKQKHMLEREEEASEKHKRTPEKAEEAAEKLNEEY